MYLGLCTNMKEQLEDMKEKAAEAAQKAAEAVTEKLNEAKEQVCFKYFRTGQ